MSICFACILTIIGCTDFECSVIADRVVREARQQDLTDQDAVNLLVIADIESGYDHHQESKAGAYGLFQIMPITEVHMNRIWRPPAEEDSRSRLDRKVLEDNIVLGVSYYKWLKGETPTLRDLLISYNWGIGNWKSWRLGLLPLLPKETRDYLKHFKKRKGQCHEIFLDR